MEQSIEKIDKNKLLEEIEELKTRIKNTEYDLEHMFKGNGLIEQKQVISKKTLEEKLKLLQTLEGTEDKQEKVKLTEEEITEKVENSISQDQEEKIEEEIEEEIM